MIVVAVGWADWMVPILSRWLTETIGGGLWGLATNVHLGKVTVELWLLHIWRPTEIVLFKTQLSKIHLCLHVTEIISSDRDRERKSSSKIYL